MNRTMDGTPIFTATRPGALPEPDESKRKRTQMLPTSMLRKKLCSLGPAKCAGCGLCEYGKEYARRKAGRETKP